MKVKIGDKIYDSKEETVMLILNEEEKKQIAKMHLNCTRYCIYQEDKITIKQIKEWMLDPPKEEWEILEGEN